MEMVTTFIFFKTATNLLNNLSPYARVLRIGPMFQRNNLFFQPIVSKRISDIAIFSRDRFLATKDGGASLFGRQTCYRGDDLYFAISSIIPCPFPPTGTVGLASKTTRIISQAYTPARQTGLCLHGRQILIKF